MATTNNNNIHIYVWLNKDLIEWLCDSMGFIYDICKCIDKCSSQTTSICSGDYCIVAAILVVTIVVVVVVVVVIVVIIAAYYRSEQLLYIYIYYIGH